VNARLTSAVPKLASLDIQRSVAFYQRIGFASLGASPDYGIVVRDGVQIHLWLCDDPNIPKATGCRINVDGVAELYDAMSVLGVVHPNGALSTKPWGWREFSITDNDGNLITFGEQAA
jgi:hypothetical protein